MTHGPLLKPVAAGTRLPGPIGKLSRSAAYRISRTLAQTGRPIVRGQLITGSNIYLDIRDPAQREILWAGQTEPGVAAVVRQLLTPGSDVVDVGANAGFYSLLCADLGAGRVLAFEPNPRTARLLTRSTAGTPVEVVQAACGDQAGTVSLRFSTDPAKAAFATIKEQTQWLNDPAWETVDVPLTTLDEACRARGVAPRLVKIDAEGAEADVIAGMAGLLAEKVPEHIICETAAGWDRPDPTPWTDRLQDAGYTPAVIGDTGLLEPYTGPILETVQNVLFTRLPDK